MVARLFGSVCCFVAGWIYVSQFEEDLTISNYVAILLILTLFIIGRRLLRSGMWVK